MLCGRPLADCNDTTFDFVLSHEGYVRQPYLDIRAIPTIAIGYAILVRSGDAFETRPTLDRDFAGIHAFSAPEKELLTVIAECLTVGDEARASALFKDRGPGVLDFSLSGDASADGRKLYDAVLPEIVKAAIPEDIRTALAGTHEMAALTSLAYNAPGLIGSGLKAAIRVGDRPAAWFEIAYRSNRARGGVRPLGLHNRRVAEAAMFGLYAGGDNPDSADEARAVLEFLDNRRDEMLAYLSSVKRTDATGAATGDAYTQEEREAILTAHAAPARGALGLA